MHDVEETSEETRARDQGRQTAAQVLDLLEAGCIDIDALRSVSFKAAAALPALAPDGKSRAATRIEAAYRGRSARRHLAVVPIVTTAGPSVSRRRSSITNDGRRSSLGGDGRLSGVSTIITKRRSSNASEPPKGKQPSGGEAEQPLPRTAHQWSVALSSVAAVKSANPNKRGSFLAKLSKFGDQSRTGETHQPAKPDKEVTEANVSVAAARPHRGSLSTRSLSEKLTSFEQAAKEPVSHQGKKSWKQERPGTWKAKSVITGGAPARRRLSQLP